MGKIARVPERVLTKSFVVLIIGNSKSKHLGAQGTFKTGWDGVSLVDFSYDGNGGRVCVGEGARLR